MEFENTLKINNLFDKDNYLSEFNKVRSQKLPFGENSDGSLDIDEVSLGEDQIVFASVNNVLTRLLENDIYNEFLLKNQEDNVDLFPGPAIVKDKDYILRQNNENTKYVYINPETQETQIVRKKPKTLDQSAKYVSLSTDGIEGKVRVNFIERMNGYYIAGTDKGVWYSTSFSQNWKKANENSPTMRQTVGKWLDKLFSGKNVVAFTNNQGFANNDSNISSYQYFMATDDGKMYGCGADITWEEISGLCVPEGTKIKKLYSDEDSGKLYILTNKGTYEYYGKKGETLRFAYGLENVSSNDFTKLDNDEKHEGSNKLFSTHNGIKQSDTAMCFKDMAVEQQFTGTVTIIKELFGYFLVGTTSGLYTKSGNTWKPFDSSLNSTYITDLVACGLYLFIGTTTGLKIYDIGSRSFVSYGSDGAAGQIRTANITHLGSFKNYVVASSSTYPSNFFQIVVSDTIKIKAKNLESSTNRINNIYTYNGVVYLITKTGIYPVKEDFKMTDLRFERLGEFGTNEINFFKSVNGVEYISIKNSESDKSWLYDFGTIYGYANEDAMKKHVEFDGDIKNIVGSYSTNSTTMNHRFIVASSGLYYFVGSIPFLDIGENKDPASCGISRIVDYSDIVAFSPVYFSGITDGDCLLLARESDPSTIEIYSWSNGSYHHTKNYSLPDNVAAQQIINDPNKKALFIVGKAENETAKLYEFPLGFVLDLDVEITDPDELATVIKTKTKRIVPGFEETITVFDAVSANISSDEYSYDITGIKDIDRFNGYPNEFDSSYAAISSDGSFVFFQQSNFRNPIPINVPNASGLSTVDSFRYDDPRLDYGALVFSTSDKLLYADTHEKNIRYRASEFGITAKNIIQISKNGYLGWSDKLLVFYNKDSESIVTCLDLTESNSEYINVVKKQVLKDESYVFVITNRRVFQFSEMLVESENEIEGEEKTFGLIPIFNVSELDENVDLSDSFVEDYAKDFVGTRQINDLYPFVIANMEEIASSSEMSSELSDMLSCYSTNFVKKLDYSKIPTTENFGMNGAKIDEYTFAHYTDLDFYNFGLEISNYIGTTVISGLEQFSDPNATSVDIVSDMKSWIASILNLSSIFDFDGTVLSVNICCLDKLQTGDFEISSTLQGEEYLSTLSLTPYTDENSNLFVKMVQEKSKYEFNMADPLLSSFSYSISSETFGEDSEDEDDEEESETSPSEPEESHSITKYTINIYPALVEAGSIVSWYKADFENKTLTEVSAITVAPGQTYVDPTGYVRIGDSEIDNVPIKHSPNEQGIQDSSLTIDNAYKIQYKQDTESIKIVFYESFDNPEIDEDDGQNVVQYFGTDTDIAFLYGTSSANRKAFVVSKIDAFEEPEDYQGTFVPHFVLRMDRKNPTNLLTYSNMDKSANIFIFNVGNEENPSYKTYVHGIDASSLVSTLNGFNRIYGAYDKFLLNKYKSTAVSNKIALLTTSGTINASVKNKDYDIEDYTVDPNDPKRNYFIDGKTHELLSYKVKSGTTFSTGTPIAQNATSLFSAISSDGDTTTEMICYQKYENANSSKLYQIDDSQQTTEILALSSFIGPQWNDGSLEYPKVRGIINGIESVLVSEQLDNNSKISFFSPVSIISFDSGLKTLKTFANGIREFRVVQRESKKLMLCITGRELQFKLFNGSQYEDNEISAFGSGWSKIEILNDSQNILDFAFFDGLLYLMTSDRLIQTNIKLDDLYASTDNRQVDTSNSKNNRSTLIYEEAGRFINAKLAVSTYEDIEKLHVKFTDSEKAFEVNSTYTITNRPEVVQISNGPNDNYSVIFATQDPLYDVYVVHNSGTGNHIYRYNGTGFDSIQSINRPTYIYFDEFNNICYLFVANGKYYLSISGIEESKDLSPNVALNLLKHNGYIFVGMDDGLYRGETTQADLDLDEENALKTPTAVNYSAMCVFGANTCYAYTVQNMDDNTKSIYPTLSRIHSTNKYIIEYDDTTRTVYPSNIIESIGTYMLFTDGNYVRVFNEQPGLNNNEYVSELYQLALGRLTGEQSLITCFGQKGEQWYVGYGRHLISFNGFEIIDYYRPAYGDLRYLKMHYKRRVNRLLKIDNQNFLVGIQNGVRYFKDGNMNLNFVDRKHPEKTIESAVQFIEDVSNTDSEPEYLVISKNKFFTNNNLVGGTFSQVLDLKDIDETVDESVTCISVFGRNNYLIGTTNGIILTKLEYELFDEMHVITFREIRRRIDELWAKVYAKHTDENTGEHALSSLVSQLQRKEDSNFENFPKEFVSGIEYLRTSKSIQGYNSDIVDTIEYEDENHYVRAGISNWIIDKMYAEAPYSFDGYYSKMTDPNDGTLINMMEIPYICMKWLSGMKDFYIYIPTTMTYYKNSPFGFSHSELATSAFQRLNFLAAGNQRNFIDSSCTKLRVYLDNAHFNLTQIHTIEINGNSLPLKIYRETENSEDEVKRGREIDTHQLYDSVVLPSVCRTLPRTTSDKLNNVNSITDDFNRICLDFSIYGTDSQSIHIIAE